MPRPPRTPPHSDLDGVDEDEVRNTDAAVEAGEDAGNLELARREAAGKPTQRHESTESDDDRSR